MSWPLSVAHERLATLLPGTATNHVQVGNCPAVRIVCSVLQPALELAHHFFAQDMLDLLRVFMHMVRGKSRGVGEIELPKTVIADNRRRPLSPRRRQEKRGAIGIQRGQPMMDKAVGLIARLLDRFAPALRELAQ